MNLSKEYLVLSIVIEDNIEEHRQTDLNNDNNKNKLQRTLSMKVEFWALSLPINLITLTN